MKNNLKDFRSIVLLVNSQKDIVIFPRSKTDYPLKLADGSLIEFGYMPAYFPIELKHPYNANELSLKIKYGIEQCDKHPCYVDSSGKLTFEEKYYGVKGFKNAVKGNYCIDLGWDDIRGKYVSLLAPLKKGYAYIGIDETRLSDDAGWIEFANAVIGYIHMNIAEFKTYKHHKSQLNF